MKRGALVFLLIGVLALQGTYAYGYEYDKFDIKYGMHEKKVAEQYGEPILVKMIKVNPIPKKKALYELDASNYMMLFFFSGRIYKITLLQDMGYDEAMSIFNQE